MVNFGLTASMIGKRIGHYVIEEKLGEGGMGVVYRARDEKLQRDIALKFLGALPAGGSAGHERILTEARAISALNHPNICTIYEIGEVDGAPYIAMEYVEGRPLSIEIPSSGMAQELVVRYGIQLAEALAHAHSRGIIHRDLKAANVIVTPGGLLKVLDFGISRRTDATGGEETTKFDKSWASQHTFTGTMPYISPEVLRGHEADERSDIWSMGVLLYEMSAGRRPFLGNTAYELSAAILRERPPSVEPPLPPVLQSVIDKCLDKEPGQRYQSAGEVRAALEAAGTATRTQDFVTTRRETLSRPRASRFTQILLGALAATTLLLAGWLLVRNKEKPRRPLPGAIQSIAVLPLENLSGDPKEDYFADGMTDALITELSQIKKLRVISRTSVMQYQHTKKPLQEIGQELNVDAIVEGSVLRDKGRVRITAKLFQTNIETALLAENFERDFTDVLALQSEVATAVAHRIQVELTSSEQLELSRSRAVVPAAYEAYLKGRYEAAKRTEEGFTAAELFFQQAVEKDPTFAGAYSGLADTYLNISNYELRPSIVMMPKAEAAAKKAVALDDRSAEAHASLASIRFYYLIPESVETEFQRAIALNPGYAHGLHWYALYLAAQGRHRESLTEIKLARDIDPRSLIINANVGWCYYLAGDYDHAIEAQKVTLGVDPSFGVSYGYLGQALTEKHRFDEAIENLRKYVSLAPGESSRKGMLAAAYGRAGKLNEVRDILAEFEQTSSQKYIDPYDWAMVYSALGEKEKTLDWLEKAFSERSGPVVNVAVHPQFSFLRKEPRFQKLVEQLRNPQKS